ncbi:hypothetical protein NQF87_05975 [Bombella sp. TMW 2.2559]|uniref:Auto-transporter adhesin head GIN domain-containing protein n=1 Tax=Bombella dulcis TaxID=2967339 RepID=A0ABT3WBR2_9PROT|nr:hypothetical protein [Bombella dulcis]MCX5616520.1 hypothetical protein [Bombella dulcis]
MSMRNVRTCLPLFLRHVCLGAVLGSSLMAESTLAAESRSILHADDLDLSVPCAQVQIRAEPGLKDSLVVEEAFGLTPDIQTTRDGTESHLRLSLHNCPKGGRLVIRLSSDTALTLHDSPQAHITISGTLTTLESNLDDASLQIERVESLDMSISGTTQAHIHQLNRAAQLNATGAARLDVDTALLSAFSAQMSDNSQLSITDGQIDSLTLNVSHQAEATVMATVNNATITTNDGAGVTLNKVTGSVQDGGTKHITHASPPEPAPEKPAVQTPAQTPQPDGQAQGLSNPVVPHIPKQAPTTPGSSTARPAATIPAVPTTSAHAVQPPAAPVPRILPQAPQQTQPTVSSPTPPAVNPPAKTIPPSGTAPAAPQNRTSQ